MTFDGRLLAGIGVLPRLPAFFATYPAVSLEVMVRDTLGDLVGEGIDVAVRFGEPEPSALIARRLLETRILTCAASAYLARHGEPPPFQFDHFRCTSAARIESRASVSAAGAGEELNASNDD